MIGLYGPRPSVATAAGGLSPVDGNVSYCRTDCWLGLVASSTEGGFGVSRWNGAALAAGEVADNHPGVTGVIADAGNDSGVTLRTFGGCFALASTVYECVWFTPPSFVSVAAKIGRHGLFNDTEQAAQPSRGIWVEYNGSSACRGYAADGGGVAQTLTAATLVASTWYRCRVEVNALRTLVTFSVYVSDTGALLWSDTLATNIPGLSSGDLLDVAALLGCDGATGNQNLGTFDFVAMQQPVTR